MDMIKKLPQEIENKIFYMTAEHPCAKMIKDSYQPAGENGYGDSFLDNKIDLKCMPRYCICKSDGTHEERDISWENVDLMFIDDVLVDIVRRRIRYKQFDCYHPDNEDIYHQTYHYYNNLENIIKMRREAFGC